MSVRRCARCIMDDSSDRMITFDELGNCSYCTNALARKDAVYMPDARGTDQLCELLARVKKAGRGRRYDCVMGLSGGLDSSYLAMLGHKWGLRVLAVHIDDGFDSDVSKANLHKLIASTGFDYEVIQPDTAQFNGLTKAYMSAGVPNLAIPQDNVLFAFLYDCVRRHRIPYFFSGANFALECVLQGGNTHDAYDLANLKDIHRQFGVDPIDRLKLISSTKRLGYRWISRLKTVMPLNYLKYERDAALSELVDFCEFEYYGRKHLENRLTEFIQLYWFPRRFGVDKRTSHLSSMIVSGQMTREDALEEFQQPLYEEQQMRECVDLIKAKLRLSDDEFEHLMRGPARQHTAFRTERTQPWWPWWVAARSLSTFVRGVRRKTRPGDRLESVVDVVE